MTRTITKKTLMTMEKICKSKTQNMPTKKNRPKMDKNFVSAQAWEIQYVASKFNISPAVVRTIRKEQGKSRRKIYAYIRSIL